MEMQRQDLIFFPFIENRFFSPATYPAYSFFTLPLVFPVTSLFPSHISVSH